MTQQVTNKSATQPNGTAEKTRELSTYYKSMVRSGHAPVNGFEMYYEIHGTGKGTPLVTIPPIWGLANVFPSLTGNRRLIAVEPQGYGHSTDVDRPFSFEQTADDIAALLKDLHIEQADFFGESIGGPVAVMMALRHPEITGRVATYGSPLRKFEESYDRRSWVT
jgi:pimeloyl-ACP methyl ester carboxylesterase